MKTREFMEAVGQLLQASLGSVRAWLGHAFSVLFIPDI